MSPADASPPEPFFEPLPEPEPVVERPKTYPQFAWQPPLNVVPVSVPVSVELARTDDTVVRLHGFDVYPQGVTYDVRVWLRPGSEPSSEPSTWDPWGESPRVGWLLEDGTKVGAEVPGHGGDEPNGDAPFHIAGVGGEAGDLRAAYGHWLHPLPPAGRWTAVTEWRSRGIPETRVEVDARPIREAAAAADAAGPLWDLPPVPEDAEFGWYAYAPMTGGAYGSRLTLSQDDPARDAGDEA
ncbi:MAG TPA: hypothetical protein VH915_05355 [Pedococcus sp.]